jgi:hypothetical protein
MMMEEQTVRGLVEPLFSDLTILYETGLTAQYAALHDAVRGDNNALNMLREGAESSPEETWIIDYLCEDRYTVLSLSVASICAHYLRLYPGE